MAYKHEPVLLPINREFQTKPLLFPDIDLWKLDEIIDRPPIFNPNFRPKFNLKRTEEQKHEIRQRILQEDRELKERNRRFKDPQEMAQLLEEYPSQPYMASTSHQELPATPVLEHLQDTTEEILEMNRQEMQEEELQELALLSQ